MYINRDENGKVTGGCLGQQYEGQEYLEETHPDYQEYLSTQEKELYNNQLESEMEAIESKKANSRAVREAVLALANGLPVPDIVKTKLQDIENLVNPLRTQYKK